MHIDSISRRAMLQRLSSGFGYLAFSALATNADRLLAASPLAVKQPHFAPKAKRVIFLCMRGAPSHVDTFDYKPKLAVDDGKQAPDAAQGVKLLSSRWNFKQRGQSGLWISDLFPEVAAHADDLCLVRSMQTDVPAHPAAYSEMHTGSFQFIRPSMGAWTLYGLGSENENLPGFISIDPTPTNGGAKNYGSAFLPAIYQGTPIGGMRTSLEGAAIRNIANPKWSAQAQRAQLDFIQTLNQQRLAADQVNPGVEGVIQSYELAFRMQGEVPRVMDLAGESAATKAMYGIGDRSTDEYARGCLLARRFAEAGVRFVQVTCQADWDQHRNLKADHEKNARSVDKPIAALLADLRQRDMLKDTLVLWGGEFGRTPGAQNGDGRDHNHKGFTMWMAGGGVKGGLSFGATDDHGAEAVEDKVHIHDWHATILHLLGLDHERLTYRYAGRDFRLTDTKGHVVKGIIA
ncbi:MAG: DUF1501 domain-containing protein [Chthoniobacteraceae bacterium]